MADRKAVRQAHQYVDANIDGSRASQAVEQALLNDDRFVDLAVAAKRAEYGLNGHRTGERDREGETYQKLREARRQTTDAVETLADEIVADALQVEMYGHSVHLEHCTELPCPVCNEQELAGSSENTQITPEAFYLGTADMREQVKRAVGWVCGRCGSTLEEQHDNNGDRVGIDVIERGRDAPDKSS